LESVLVAAFAGNEIARLRDVFAGDVTSWRAQFRGKKLPVSNSANDLPNFGTRPERIAANSIK